MDLKLHIDKFGQCKVSGQYVFGIDRSKAIAAIREFADQLEADLKIADRASPIPKGTHLLQEVRLSQSLMRDDFAITELTFVMAEATAEIADG